MIKGDGGGQVRFVPMYHVKGDKRALTKRSRPRELQVINTEHKDDKRACSRDEDGVDQSQSNDQTTSRRVRKD